MKKVCLIIALVLIASLCFAGRIQQHHMMIIGQEQGAAGISDDFNRGDNDSMGSDWSEDNGDWDILSNQAIIGTTTNAPLRWTTATGDVGQWVKVQMITNTNGFFGVLLRSPESSGYRYMVGYDNQDGYTRWLVFNWNAWNQTVQQNNATISWSDTDYMGVTVQGTGNDTIINIWQNPTAASPSTANNWDGANDYDLQFTNDPNNPADTGEYIGIYGHEEGTSPEIVADNFSGGLY